jgi:hypothetical protein
MGFSLIFTGGAMGELQASKFNAEALNRGDAESGLKDIKFSITSASLSGSAPLR